jgi:hypothetical protein
MDLITIILVVGSLVNGGLLTLCMRYARSANEQATQAKDLAYAAGLSAESVHGKLDLAIAALPKKRKPRKLKAESYDVVNDPDGRIEAEIEEETSKLAEGMRNTNVCK